MRTRTEAEKASWDINQLTVHACTILDSNKSKNLKPAYPLSTLHISCYIVLMHQIFIEFVGGWGKRGEPYLLYFPYQIYCITTKSLILDDQVLQY